MAVNDGYMMDGLKTHRGCGSPPFCHGARKIKTLKIMENDHWEPFSLQRGVDT